MSSTSTPETAPAPPGSSLPANQVYGIAAICLVVGLVIGYFLLPSGRAARVVPVPPPSSASGAMPSTHPQITVDQMKQMATVQASSLVEKAKSDPNNAALLVQIAGIYQSGHQFKEAAEYLQKALKIDPKDVSARTQLASCLFYTEDVDGALAQLNQALKYDPKNVNALFNLGMIKYRGKNDAKGAIAAWQQLLRDHPDLDRKPVVEQMIAEAKSSTETKN
ncbi:MAG TPA: tetratricopeptide repeat protein [Verrucomicrobiae bacterium]|nr:tetratricopeptide repeat protein [Verrucomicrobiae bacterium]